jgi:HK97 family phage prohead protease
MEIKQFAFAIETKATKGDGTFTGKASTYGDLDLGGDIVMPGAFADAFANGGRTKILKQHMHDCSIGLGILSDSPEALLIDGALELGLFDAQQEWIRLSKGLIDGLSIGYSVLPGGERYERGVRLLTNLKLHEVSLVTYPMNTLSRVTGIKQGLEARFESIMTEIKGGRVLSASNRALVQEAHDAMGAMLAQLGKLLEESAPKPKEPTEETEGDEPEETEDEKAAREEAERKAVDDAAKAAAEAAEAKSLEELLQSLRAFNSGK